MGCDGELHVDGEGDVDEMNRLGGLGFWIGRWSGVGWSGVRPSGVEWSGWVAD